ncbi:MAG: hypothetical protein R6W90_07580 [Ignavibacteriaceae bacterium]
MKKDIKKYLFIPLLLLYTGCSNTKEITEIKPKIIKPPVIEDILPAELQETRPEGLTVFNAVEVNKNDTVKYIEFRPDSLLLDKIKELREDNKILKNESKNIGEFYFRIKPDSIIVWDTVKVTQVIEKKIETPLLSKAGLILIGIILGLAGLYYIRR